MAPARICARCVLPASPPEISLDAAGICTLCREHDARRAREPETKFLETDFLKIVDQHRGRHQYDCLVMCSGGKDSTAALYYMKKRYKLNCLAFTFDHGFETADALENVRNAVEKLDVDFVLHRSTFMNDMFAKVLKTGSKAVLCHLCSMWYMDLTFKTAARYDAPIIIAGGTKGQMTRQPVMSKCACSVSAPEYARMGRATKDFLLTLKDDPKYADFPASMEELLARAKKRHKSLVLSPHWFLPYSADEYLETISKELGWKFPRLSYPARSTNCSLNFISVHNSMKYYGYTHYHVEMSKMIRGGLLSRDEALELLRLDFDTALLDRIAAPLGHRFG